MLKIIEIVVKCDICGVINLPFKKKMKCSCGEQIFTQSEEISIYKDAYKILLDLGYSYNDISLAIKDKFFVNSGDIISCVRDYVNRTRDNKKTN